MRGSDTLDARRVRSVVAKQIHICIHAHIHAHMHAYYMHTCILHAYMHIYIGI